MGSGEGADRGNPKKSWKFEIRRWSFEGRGKRDEHALNYLSAKMIPLSRRSGMGRLGPITVICNQIIDALQMCSPCRPYFAPCFVCCFLAWGNWLGLSRLARDFNSVGVTHCQGMGESLISELLTLWPNSDDSDSNRDSLIGWVMTPYKVELIFYLLLTVLLFLGSRTNKWPTSRADTSWHFLVVVQLIRGQTRTEISWTTTKICPKVSAQSINQGGDMKFKKR